MIRVDVKRKDDEIVGFHVEGHAGLAEAGSDILCASVSALVINCVNSIEEFTDCVIQLEKDEETGMIDFTIDDPTDPKVRLLLESLSLGLSSIAEDFTDDYITFH